jgi:hypothetical protein
MPSLCCIQAMEDFFVAYDDTVRGSGDQMLQFQYGDDGLDPSFMEASGEPVDYERLLFTVKVPWRFSLRTCGLFASALTRPVAGLPRSLVFVQRQAKRSCHRFS